MHTAHDQRAVWSEQVSKSARAIHRVLSICFHANLASPPTERVVCRETEDCFSVLFCITGPSEKNFRRTSETRMIEHLSWAPVDPVQCRVWTVCSPFANPWSTFSSLEMQVSSSRIILVHCTKLLISLCSSHWSQFSFIRAVYFACRTNCFPQFSLTHSSDICLAKIYHFPPCTDMHCPNAEENKSTPQKIWREQSSERVDRPVIVFASVSADSLSQLVSKESSEDNWINGTCSWKLLFSQQEKQRESKSSIGSGIKRRIATSRGTRSRDGKPGLSTTDQPADTVWGDALQTRWDPGPSYETGRFGTSLVLLCQMNSGAFCAHRFGGRRGSNQSSLWYIVRLSEWRRVSPGISSVSNVQFIYSPDVNSKNSMEKQKVRLRWCTCSSIRATSDIPFSQSWGVFKPRGGSRMTSRPGPTLVPESLKCSQDSPDLSPGFPSTTSSLVRPWFWSCFLWYFWSCFISKLWQLFVRRCWCHSNRQTAHLNLSLYFCTDLSFGVAWWKFGSLSLCTFWIVLQRCTTAMTSKGTECSRTTYTCLKGTTEKPVCHNTHNLLTSK